MRLAFSLLFVILWVKANSQVFYLKSHVGALYYQGDLAPKPLDLSFGPGNLCWGISAGYGVNDWATLYSRFMIGRLTGDDAFASDPARKLRNLSFASPLYEYGVYTDLNINQLWRGLNKYKIKLYLTLGVNLIQFDPHAFYKGKWIPLQPLGTEGQTLPNSGKSKYSLTNISRLTGLIIEFDFSRQWSFGMEVSPRKTYTDYLDDVSTTYANYEEMLANGNALGAALTNRTGEYIGTTPISVPSGTPRGRSDKKDWYTYFGLSFKYKFGKGLIKTSCQIPDDSMSEEEWKSAP